MNIEDSEILEAGLDKLWNIINLMKEEEGLSKEELENIETIRKGIIIKVPIQYIIKKYYTEYPSNKNVQVSGHGKYPIEIFWHEIERRETELRKIIMDNNNEENAVESR